MTYLDYNATAPIRPEAADAAVRALALGGNPSSVHAAGRAARAAVERAREQVASLVGARASGVVFTSGGAEANALAIHSALAGGSRRMLVSAVEHDTVQASAAASGAVVTIWPVDTEGRADLDWLADRLGDWNLEDGPPFVALMLANNETGVVQAVPEATAMVRRAGGLLHVDAVQAGGKIKVEIEALGSDTLSLSAHKLGGPQGAGAVVFGPRASPTRQLHGGGQERGARAGTENVSGIAGFGAAAEAARRDLAASTNQAAWRDAVADRLVAEAGVRVMGAGAERLSNTLCFGVPGFSAELQVMALDLDGVMVSAGAACSSGKVRASHVLEAMGEHELAGSSIRVSGGWATTKADWDRFADAWLDAWVRHITRRKSSAA